MRWHLRGGATSPKTGGGSGPNGAGERRHGDGRRGNQRVEGSAGITGLTEAAQGLARLVGGEGFGGGVERSMAAKKLRRCSSGEEVRTGWRR